ncbi:MAG: SDR family NAD(P)-dependent oxidoreductase [Polyangiaceae bacterium]|nr:SDR family NAD(P)-dependent oxidoreductase [Polyangiaceae bacterium]
MHVAITGASAGIGAALAREYASRGAKLTLVARRKDRLEELAKEAKHAFTVQADLGDVDHCADWVDDAVRTLGPIDVLVNNAGIQIIGPTESESVHKGEDLLRLNVFAPMRLTRAILPSMLERKTGTIIDIASAAAIGPMPGMFYYNASKGALANASEGLRGELLGTGVHVVTVYPGPVDTDMGQAGYTKYEQTTISRLAPLGRADVLAKRIVRAAEKKKARVIYPRLYVLAFMFPGLARWVTPRISPPLLPRNVQPK